MLNKNNELMMDLNLWATVFKSQTVALNPQFVIQSGLLIRDLVIHGNSYWQISKMPQIPPTSIGILDLKCCHICSDLSLAKFKVAQANFKWKAGQHPGGFFGLGKLEKRLLIGSICFLCNFSLSNHTTSCLKYGKNAFLFNASLPYHF